MLDGMKPLCEKYNTSIGNLVLAHTLSQGNFMNVLFGSRSIKTVEQSSLAMDIILDKEDIAKMDRLASIAKIN
jgi:aryl-alcohol dehydrogenase-like predicted oxidoreductase